MTGTFSLRHVLGVNVDDAQPRCSSTWRHRTGVCTVRRSPRRKAKSAWQTSLLAIPYSVLWLR
jgi:hypothetical protein